jgi:sulfite reductase (NADPH) hemoprotein beta-component
MYRYDAIDKEFLADRAAEFRGQVARRLSGEITEDQF